MDIERDAPVPATVNAPYVESKTVSSRVMRAASVALLVAMCGITSCGPRNANNYTAAGVGLGVAVAGTVVYRAVTGNCVAMCQPGNICDRESGLCIPYECSPPCPEGQQCVRDVDKKMRCEPVGITVAPAANRPSGTSDAGVDAVAL